MYNRSERIRQELSGDLFDFPCSATFRSYANADDMPCRALEQVKIQDEPVVTPFIRQELQRIADKYMLPETDNKKQATRQKTIKKKGITLW